MDITPNPITTVHTQKEWNDILIQKTEEVSKGVGGFGTIVVGSNVAKIIQAYINQN